MGWGPKKTELVLPLNCDPDSLPLLRDPANHPLPDIVLGFMACLGVPRHPTCDEKFITAALEPVALPHDSLLELAADVSDEDPLAALRLLQVCGINTFGHILSAVLSLVTRILATRDLEGV